MITRARIEEELEGIEIAIEEAETQAKHIDEYTAPEIIEYARRSIEWLTYCKEVSIVALNTMGGSE